ncbi:MAG: hypothetical protein L6R39_003533 [Caloplaca ligustica]|nr:MAG: hypothetical protein L6R39_003533 [Caloplaca ligustica]
MSPSTSKTLSALARYRPAILAVTAIVAGLIIYAVSSDTYASQVPKKDPSKKSATSLHRSNAQRRPRGRRTSSARGAETGFFFSYTEGYREGASISHGRYHRGQRVFGRYRRHTNNGRHEVLLVPNQLPSTSRIHTEWAVDVAEATLIRQELEIILLDNFFAQEMPPGPPVPLSQSAREGFVRAFAAAGQISAANTEASIDRYERGDLDGNWERRDRTDATDEPRPSQLWNSDAETLPRDTPGDLSPTFQILCDMTEGPSGDDETIADTESDRSNEAEGEDENKPSQDQNLMNLLYRIAEDQAKKEGFVHRGVTCNSCNAMPVRGIRYRCTNCHDYDLCEQCEALQVHDKTHLFYKIRVPAPFLGSPREAQPVWYPGKPGRAARSLTTELKMKLSTRTGIQDWQVDAYWEQFQCLAAHRYPDDPHGFDAAIGRSSFNQCFVPNVTPRPPPPNLAYDRMFAFYDTNGDGLIGFEEFLSGIACIAHGGKELRTRIFQAYDVDNDGFVDRKDFLRMFRGYYAHSKELTRQIVSGMEDEFFDLEDARQLIVGSQPISSIFSGPIPSGEPSRPSYPGKTENSRGDLVIYDGQGIMREDDSENVYGKHCEDNIIADNAEIGHFGSCETPWLPGLPRLTLDVNDEHWPRRWIIPRDVEEALGRVAEPDTIEDHVERSLVMCASQERAQQDRWLRESFRRRILNSRWQARAFYLDGESMSQPPWGDSDEQATSEQEAFGENDLCSLRIKALERNEEPELLEGFHVAIKRAVKATWPDYPDLEGVPERFRTWIRKRYKWHKLAEALAPSRQDIPEATHVVQDLLNSYFNVRRFVIPRRLLHAPDEAHPSPTTFILRDIARRARGEPSEGGEECDSHASSPRQASESAKSPSLGQIPELELSPSKDKLAQQSDGDDDEASSSATSVASETIGVLVGQRHGVDEIPEPEATVGREVIYQVTQESMNELLDPMFKLREDLAIEVMKTQRERDLYKSEIREFMHYTPKFMSLFEEYQKRWYRDAREFDALAPSQSSMLVEFVIKCLRKQGFEGMGLGYHHVEEPKQGDEANLQEATDAIIKLDQSVANEVEGESASAVAGQKQGTSDVPADEISNETVPEDPIVALNLEESVTAFHKADLKVGESTKDKPLELLLADAGYGVVTPPVQNPEKSDLTSLSQPRTPNSERVGEDEPDPTLPQNRPNSIEEWEAMQANMDKAAIYSYTDSELSSVRSDSPSPEQQPESVPLLSEERLFVLALWEVIAADDKSRGGPGRLNLHDYELIMEGDKGQGLGFVGSWIETAAF